MEPPKIWREKRERYLAIGIQCQDCKSKSFPKTSFCTKCSSSNITEYRLATSGKLLNFTKVTSTSKEMNSYAPFFVGIIELDDGITVTGQIVDCKFEDLQDEMRVRMVFRVLARNGEEGLIRYGFKFTPE